MKVLVIDGCNQCCYWDERFMICNHPEAIEKYTDNREGDGFPGVCPLDDVLHKSESQRRD